MSSGFTDHLFTGAASWISENLICRLKQA